MHWQDHIVSDPATLFGRPRIKGIRIGVEFVLELLASGWGEAQILENYPQLKAEDLQALAETPAGFYAVISKETMRLRSLPS